MLIVGDISGIQSYLFDVAHEGGGQARRLRARSFFIQILGECLALRVERVLGWGQKQLLFSGAGKFIFAGGALQLDILERLAAERRVIDSWLLQNCGAGLRFTLVTETGDDTAHAQYERAISALQSHKLRSWSSLAIEDGRWQPARMVLEPLDTPCALCGRRSATENEQDQDTGETRRICRRCHEDKRLGGFLPSARWLTIRERPLVGHPHQYEVCGLHVALFSTSPRDDDSTLAVVDLHKPQQTPVGFPPGKHLKRRLTWNVPKADDGSLLEFGDIADRANGDALLGVLKMDADSLGQALSQRLGASRDFDEMRQFSEKLDQFFSTVIQEDLSREPVWRFLYTIFSGGDDLLLVGPWDAVLDYAGHVAKRFAATFPGLTLSAGVALADPRRPIRLGAAEADELLEKAKSQRAPASAQPKDQCATLGSLWKWQDHRSLLEQGKKLAGWVQGKAMERGWLYTLLELTVARGSDPLATARLAHHVGRNYPNAGAPREKGEVRRWADGLLEEFEGPSTPAAVHLAAVLRYALAATRSPKKEN